MVDDLTLNDTEEIKGRHIVDVRVTDRLHGVAGNVAGCQHTVQFAVSVNDRENRDGTGVVQRVPSPAHRDRMVQGGRRIIV